MTRCLWLDFDHTDAPDCDCPDLILKKIAAEGLEFLIVCSIYREPAEDAFRSKRKHNSRPYVRQKKQTSSDIHRNQVDVRTAGRVGVSVGPSDEASVRSTMKQ